MVCIYIYIYRVVFFEKRTLWSLVSTHSSSGLAATRKNQCIDECLNGVQGGDVPSM